MTFAKFDDRNQILEILRALDLSISQFSRLQIDTTLPRWTVERILNGDRLDQTGAADLLRLAREVKALQDSFPLRLDFNDAFAIQSCLRQRRELARQLTAPNSKTPLPIVESQPASPSEIESAVDAIHGEAR